MEQIPEESDRKRPRNRARKTQEKPRQGRKAVRQDKRMRHDYRRNRDGRRRHLRRTPRHPRTGIQTLARIRVDKISGRPRRATHAREEVKRNGLHVTFWKPATTIHKSIQKGAYHTKGLCTL